MTDRKLSSTYMYMYTKFQLLKSLLFDILTAPKGYPFQVEPPHKVHFREWGWGGGRGGAIPLLLSDKFKIGHTPGHSQCSESEDMRPLNMKPPR